MHNLHHSAKRPHMKDETMMKALYEELGGIYTLGDDGMLYPNLVIVNKEQSCWKMEQDAHEISGGRTSGVV